MTRAVVNVSTTPAYRKGQARLSAALRKENCCEFFWSSLAPMWPTHEDKPYAFKAYALDVARGACDLLLWADACILPVQRLDPLWERIQHDGYWFSQNGWNNYEWTAESAYPDLFNLMADDGPWWNPLKQRAGFGESSAICVGASTMDQAIREMNRSIPHVVATSFGVNVRHPKGKAFLDEYFRLASETSAFCGPWSNWNYFNPETKTYSNQGAGPHVKECGPADVRGHRHDQTAASVIAWRLGFKLTAPPDIFAYGKEGDTLDNRTILLADGAY